MCVCVCVCARARACSVRACVLAYCHQMMLLISHAHATFLHALSSSFQLQHARLILNTAVEEDAPINSASNSRWSPGAMVHMHSGFDQGMLSRALIVPPGQVCGCVFWVGWSRRSKNFTEFIKTEHQARDQGQGFRFKGLIDSRPLTRCRRLFLSPGTCTKVTVLHIQSITVHAFIVQEHPTCKVRQ